MKNLMLTFFALFLITTVSHANVTMVAKTQQLNDTLNIEFTLNNQANDSIETDSKLIPASAQKLLPQDAVSFDINIPAKRGSQKFRYKNGEFGCDFYLDTSNISGPTGLYQTQITAMPISSNSMCNVFQAGGVNHLAISFFKLGH